MGQHWRSALTAGRRALSDWRILPASAQAAHLGPGRRAVGPKWWAVSAEQRLLPGSLVQCSSEDVHCDGPHGPS